MTRRDKIKDERSSLLEALASEPEWRDEAASPLPPVEAAAASRTAADAEPEREGLSLRDEVLRSVRLKVKIELGRTRLPLSAALNLTSGAVIELARSAGDPVDIVVHGVPIARGQVVVVDGKFCIRITEVVPAELGEADK